MAVAHAATNRPRRWRWTALAAVALAVAGIDQALHTWLADRGSPLGAAAWIWSRDPSREAMPQAIFLVRDFELDSAPPAATLAVGGDEEYVLYLNGRRLGSGAYADGAPLDRYEVGEILVTGGNRLLAEVRSSRGVGGFLLSLQAGPEILVESDGSWRVIRAFEPGLRAGWRNLGGSEPSQVWGVPPVGRWGRPTVGPPRPLADPVARLPAIQRTVSQPAPTLHATLFDWGEPKAGHLLLELPAGGCSPALLFVGDAPPEPETQAVAGFVLAPPGAPSWREAVPRRFRYALVLGAEAPTAAWVEPLGAETDLARSEPSAARGVFGLRPPPRQLWLEADIRRRLREVRATAEHP